MLLLRNVIALGLLSLPLSAQNGAGAAAAPIPVNSANIDYIGSVTAAIDDLVTAGSPVFLTTGNELLTAIGVIMLVIYGLKWATHSASSHHPEFDFPGVIQFFALFLVAEAMLRYYNVPLPWANSSFHQILPDTARQLAATIDLTGMDALLSRINSVVMTTERPGVTDPLMFLVYFTIMIDMIAIEGILFAVTILGFIAVGIGSVLGPIFIPWLIVPRLSWLFWNWIQFMLQYSFYRVVASALTFVWSTVLLKFFDNAVQGDYTLAHFLIMLVPLGMLNIGMIFSVFRITSFVSDLFKGTAAAGGGMVGSVATVIRGAFA
jgi:hypothetical protein